MRIPLSIKISALVLLLVTFGGGVMGYLIYHKVAYTLQGQIRLSQLETNRQTMDKIDRFLYERTIDMQNLAGREQLQRYIKSSHRTSESSEELKKQLDDFSIIAGVWVDMTLTDTQGSVVLTTDTPQSADLLSKQPEFKSLVARAALGQNVHTDVIMEMSKKVPLMLFMSPVRDMQAPGHPIVGVAVGELAWPSVLEILDSLHGVNAKLLNQQGISLGSNGTGGLAETLVVNDSHQPIYLLSRKGQEGTEITQGINDSDHKYVTTYVKQTGYLNYLGNGWTLVMDAPESVAFAAARDTTRNLVVVFLGLLLILVVFLLLILHRLFVQPIIQLKNVSQRLAVGDFSQPVVITSRDEIGDLGIAFNTMAERLQVAYGNLTKTATQAQGDKQLVEALLQNLPVGVLVIDATNGKILLINKAALELTGNNSTAEVDHEMDVSTYEVLREDGSIYPVSELPMTISIMTGKNCFKDDLYIRRPDGTMMAIRTISAPIKRNKGKVESAVMVFEDISVERSLERTREEFFSIASHELRTPLTAIRGNSSMIQEYYGDQLRDKDLKEMVSDIHESSIRLIEIVNDFLDTSRLEQKRMKYDLKAFDMVELANAVIKEYQVTGSRKKIHLEVIPPDKSLPMAFADSNRSKQVLINLVGNALKFTDEGSVALTFERGSKFIKVLVTDTGVGISPEAQRLLFRKFEQSGKSVLTRDSVRGTGLGLYISKLIAEQMHGRVALRYSELGAGTAFEFAVPLSASVPKKK